MSADFIILETLDTLPAPLPAEDIAAFADPFFRDAGLDATPDERLRLTREALPRLERLGFAASTPSIKTGKNYAITTAGRNASRNA